MYFFNIFTISFSIPINKIHSRFEISFISFFFVISYSHLYIFAMSQSFVLSCIFYCRSCYYFFFHIHSFAPRVPNGKWFYYFYYFSSQFQTLNINNFCACAFWFFIKTKFLTVNKKKLLLFFRFCCCCDSIDSIINKFVVGIWAFRIILLILMCLN